MHDDLDERVSAHDGQIHRLFRGMRAASSEAQELYGLIETGMVNGDQRFEAFRAEICDRLDQVNERLDELVALVAPASLSAADGRLLVETRAPVPTA